MTAINTHRPLPRGVDVADEGGDDLVRGRVVRGGVADAARAGRVHLGCVGVGEGVGLVGVHEERFVAAEAGEAQGVVPVGAVGGDAAQEGAPVGVEREVACGGGAGAWGEAGVGGVDEDGAVVEDRESRTRRPD